MPDDILKQDPPVEPEPTPPVVEPTPPLEAVPPDDADKEPGGDDPQAVRARKEYRRRKTAEETAQLEREARIRAEAESKALREVKQAPPAKFKAADVLAAVNRGEVTREDAARYFGKPIEVALTEETVDDRIRQAQQQFALQSVQQQAATKIQQYMQHVPGLAKAGSAELQEVAKEHTALLQQGYPDTLNTQVLALQTVYGPLARLEGKREAMQQQREHADHPGGFGTTPRPGPKPAPDAGLTDRQRAFYKEKGWDPAAHAKYANVKTAADLPAKAK